MRKKNPREIAFAGARLAGLIVLHLVVLAVVLYFLGSGGAGRGVVSWLSQEELNGEAEVGNLVLDPASGGFSAVDLVVRDRADNKVVEAGAVEVVVPGYDPDDLALLNLQRVLVRLVMDEEGHFNLDGLFPERPEEPPSKPSPFAINLLRIDDSSVVVETPWGAAEVGPIAVRGLIDNPSEGFPAGNAEAEIARIFLAPSQGEAGAWLTGLLGTEGPYEFGPLRGKARWGEDRVVLESAQLSFPWANVTLQADLNVVQLLGQVSLSVTRDGREVAALLGEREMDRWLLSALVNELRIPGRADGPLPIPSVELTGLSVNAIGEQCTVKLNRLAVGTYRTEHETLGPLSLSGHLHYEASRPLDVLAMGDGGKRGSLADFVRAWRKGRVSLLGLLDEWRVRETVIAEPLRLRVEGQRTEDGKLQLEATMTFHPHGSIRARLDADYRNRNGYVPYVASVEVESLETAPLLVAADVPGMLKGMLTGTLSGRLEFAAHDVGASVVKVLNCRFDLDHPQGGGMAFVTPDEEQRWDLSASPSFSFFTKEVKFGKGRLLMQAKPQPQPR